MKLILHHSSFAISSIPVNLLQKLGWIHGEKLRSYAYDGTMIVEKLEHGESMILYQLKSKSDSTIRCSINHIEPALLETLGWKKGFQFVATCFKDKLIIRQSMLQKVARNDSFRYFEEQIKLDNFVLKKLREMFEA